MRKKVIGVILVVGAALQLSGCNSKEGTVETVPEEVITAVATGKVAIAFDYDIFTKEDFKDFFKQYFSLTEDEMLRFNQNPIHIIENDNDKACTSRLETLLTGYLSDGAKAQLNKGYYRACFDLPKKLEVNEYVTYEAAMVEDVAIVATTSSGGNRVYEVAVTTKNKVKPISEANKDYVWDCEKQYYMSLGAATKPQLAFLSTGSIGTALNESYTYQQIPEEGRLDEIRLVQTYWVTVANGNTLKVESVKEAVPYQTTEATRQKASNTKFVTRIPYTETVSSHQKSKVIETLNAFITQPKAFYTFYEKAFNTGYNSVYSIIRTKLNVAKDIIVSKESYKSAFNSNLNPYKDHMMAIKIDKETITVTPSIYGTKAQPRFKVIVPAKVVYTTGEEACYNYEYFVGMEKEKIEFIQGLGMTPFEEEKEKP